jgi:AraC-like DNA-binding protein
MVFRVCRPDAARVHGIGSVTLTPGDTGGLACSFPSRWLLEPMRSVSTKPSVEESARAGLVPPRDIVVALRSSILAQIHDPDLDVARLVKQMGLNRRAAQKLLRERGSGFRELLDELRREQAIQKIASGRYSVKGTAQALGYSDAANFTRAFRRWTGMSPSAFLRQRTPSEHGVPEARPDDSSTSARSAGKRLKRLHDRVAEE